MAERALNSYDEVPYESIAFSSTHPENLATMAHLFGVPSPPVETCRVLELGCAAGGNLVPMAETLPDAHFHGIDLSARQIDEGAALVKRLGLQNIVLEQRDIMSVDSSLGSFDYIICHGVYSWVADAVRKKIMTICRDHLSVHGVAYISYNTYPGWHMRASVREMMSYHAGRFDSVSERIEQARALLDFLNEAVPEDDEGAYGKLLRDELEIIRNRADAYLFHEHLEEHNEAIYFHRFMQQASEAALAYLGEAHLGDMLPGGRFAPEVEQTLRDIAPDIIHMEQYLDFLRNRMFRRTLLCHEGVELNREIEPAHLYDFYVSSPLAPEDTDGLQAIGDALSFRHPNNATVTVHHPTEHAALCYLYSIWPSSVTLREVAKRVRSDEEDAEECLALVGQMILNCVSADVVELCVAPTRFSACPGEKPCTSGLARHQAEESTWVTNLKHVLVFPDEFAREVLCLLDGQLSVPALKDVLIEKAVTGALVVKRNGERLTDRRALREVMNGRVEEKLEELAGLALLR